VTISITNTQPTSFKVELLQGVHNFTAGTGDVFKIALLKATSAADGVFGASTTNYSALGTAELPTGGGYVAGGALLTAITPTASETSAVCSFVDVTWPVATFTTCGAVIYNETAGGAACAVLSFNGDQQVSGGDFTIQFPVATAASAVVRVS
jgi:hypothetical protein